MYFIQKLEDKLTLKSPLNEQKYFFLTFNMKKMSPGFRSWQFFSPKLMNAILTSQSAECS